MMSIEGSAITIKGKKIDFVNYKFPIEQLKFYPKNPRILPLLEGIPEGLTHEELQEEIQKRMMKEESVKNLISQILDHEGLTEEIVVVRKTMQVIEGNSRLAVFRYLYEKNDHSDKWRYIPCKVISDLTPQQVLAYLHSLHVKGKTTWGAYQKAYLFYDKYKNEKLSIEEIREITDASVQEIKKRISTVELMKENGDAQDGHYSYYELMYYSQKVGKFCQDDDELKRILLDKIKNIDNVKDTEEYFTALHLRDYLSYICMKPKILKKFKKGKMTFMDAYYSSKISVSGLLMTIKRIRELLRGVGKSDMEHLDANNQNAVRTEYRRLCQDVDRLDIIIKS